MANPCHATAELECTGSPAIRRGVRSGSRLCWIRRAGAPGIRLPVFDQSLMDFASQTWGWIVGIIFVFPILLSIAELSSSLPTCGGLYYASAALAPKGWAGFVSWISGWTSFVGWTAAGPSIDFAMARWVLRRVEAGRRRPLTLSLSPSSLITSELAAYISGYTVKVWHSAYFPRHRLFVLTLPPTSAYVIFLAVITSHFIIACSPSRVLGRTNIIGAFFSLGAIAVFLVAVTWVSPDSLHDAAELISSINPLRRASLRKRSQYQSDITTWTKTTEGGSPNAVAFLQSIILGPFLSSQPTAAFRLSVSPESATYTFSGMAAPLHLSEECVNAALVGPQAMVRGAQVTATAGFLLLLTMAYTVRCILTPRALKKQTTQAVHSYRSIPAPLTTPNAILTAYLTPVGLRSLRTSPPPPDALNLRPVPLAGTRKRRGFGHVYPRHHFGLFRRHRMLRKRLPSCLLPRARRDPPLRRCLAQAEPQNAHPRQRGTFMLGDRNHYWASRVRFSAGYDWCVLRTTVADALAWLTSSFAALFSVTGLAQYVAFFIPLSLKLFSGKFKQGGGLFWPCRQTVSDSLACE